MKDIIEIILYIIMAVGGIAGIGGVFVNDRLEGYIENKKLLDFKIK